MINCFIACSVEVTCIVTVITLENMFCNIKSPTEKQGKGNSAVDVACLQMLNISHRKICIYLFTFYSKRVFFPNYSQITGLQGKGEGISSTPHYHLHLLHRHLDISQPITAESSPLHISSSRTRTRNLWFSSESCYSLGWNNPSVD